MPQRGYVTTSALLRHLQAELGKRGIETRVVESPLPEYLGTTPRPIYILEQGQSPKGWTRYGRCTTCRKAPATLNDSGLVHKTCQSCRDASFETMTVESLWAAMERETYRQELGLPADWAYDCKTVRDVREALQDGTISRVGPEREAAVSEALQRWRHRVVDMLNADV